MFVPHMPVNLEDLSHRIVEAVKSISTDQLIWVYHEVEFHFDVCHSAPGAHFECIQVEQP